MKIILCTAIAVIMATVSITPASAFVTAKQAIEMFDNGGEVGKVYMRGMGEGISWANTATSIAGNPALYCPPETVGVVGEQYVAILKGFIKRYPNLASAPFGGTLLGALQEAFPCKR
jgi:hypothetical protein